jgi:hypothetical protein
MGPKLIGAHQPLVYADDVNLPGDKTEYMLLFSQQNARAKS